jgi:hypothetical protein
VLINIWWSATCKRLKNLQSIDNQLVMNIETKTTLLD